MGCSGSSESKSDSNKVVPQKQQQQQEKQPLSDVSSIDEKSPKKSIDEISTDYDKYKRRREPEPRQIKGLYYERPFEKRQKKLQSASRIWIDESR